MHVCAACCWTDIVQAGISALAYSSCGRYLAAGDYNGVIRIYSPDDEQVALLHFDAWLSCAQVAEIVMHKKMVSCLAFSFCSCSPAGVCGVVQRAPLTIIRARQGVHSQAGLVLDRHNRCCCDFQCRQITPSQCACLT